MDKGKKAAIFNALLFPGCGHFYLKHYVKGLIFLVPVLIGSLSLVWMITMVGVAMIKTAPFKKGTVQFENIVQIVVNSFKSIDLSTFFLILILITCLWLLSILDAYRIGRKQP